MQLSRTTHVSLLRRHRRLRRLPRPRRRTRRRGPTADRSRHTCGRASPWRMPWIPPSTHRSPPICPRNRPAPAAAPSANVTINLINRLVAKGILTQAEAAEMIQQAEADAATAAAQNDIAALPPEPTPEEEMRITYIPEVVRNQMRDQIKQELMAQAREEEWSEKQHAGMDLDKFRPFGDLRVRSDNTFFPDGNDNTGAFPNFNAINTGSPFDTSGTQFSPQYNVDQDRNRTRLRARVGTEIMLGDGFNGGIRLATGDEQRPHLHQPDARRHRRQFLQVRHLARPRLPQLRRRSRRWRGTQRSCSAASTIPSCPPSMHWDEDLGFDGLAVRGKVRINDCVSTFFTAGYFPVYNTDFNFASNQPSKFESTDKWLTGAQMGHRLEDQRRTQRQVRVCLL